MRVLGLVLTASGLFCLGLLLYLCMSLMGGASDEDPTNSVSTHLARRARRVLPRLWWKLLVFGLVATPIGFALSR